jgi:RNA polymerase sigma-70 factor (ECF subfamily)
MGLDKAMNPPAEPQATSVLGDGRADARGDALHNLIRDYHAPVTRLAYRLLGWRGDVEDMVHDVFLAAFQKLDRFRGDASTWTWLAAITINRCRSLRRRRLLYFRWIHKRELNCETESSDQRAERDDTTQKVRDAVARLSPRDRELIVLHYLEELPVSEICKLTGASDKTIHVRLHRARKRLKDLLGNE